MVYYYLLYRPFGSYAIGYISIKDVDLNTPGYILNRKRVNVTWEQIYNSFIHLQPPNIDETVNSWLILFITSLTLTPTLEILIATYLYNYDMFDKTVELLVRYHGLDGVINVLHQRKANGEIDILSTARSLYLYNDYISEGLLDVMETSVREKYT
jgi:hypothetical protein